MVSVLLFPLLVSVFFLPIFVPVVVVVARVFLYFVGHEASSYEVKDWVGFLLAKLMETGITSVLAMPWACRVVR